MRSLSASGIRLPRGAGSVLAVVAVQPVDAVQVAAHVVADLAKVATFYKPVRLGAISASLFPDTLTDAKGTFHTLPAW